LSFAHTHAQTACKAKQKRGNTHNHEKANSRTNLFSPVEKVLFLQRNLGNHAVQSLIKSGRIQAKLNINSFSDVFEREADDLAEQVASGDNISVTNGVANFTRNHPVHTEIQQKANPNSSSTAESSASGFENRSEWENKLSSQRNCGQHLPETVRQNAEQQFGYNFGSVRIHNDSQAAWLSNSINANAFTSGNDIFFAAGKYHPDSYLGKKLIAHELTHTIQQGAASPKTSFTSLHPRSITKVGGRAVQRKAIAPSTNIKKPPPAEGEIAPEVLELKGKGSIKPEAHKNVSRWLEEKGNTGLVNVRFGKFAEGPVKITKTNETYEASQTLLPIKGHPLFGNFDQLPSKMLPGLVVQIKKNEITGHIGFGSSGKKGLARVLMQNAELIGLTGFDIGRIPTISTNLQDGALKIGPAEIPVSFGNVVKGSVSLSADDEKITAFKGTVEANIRRLKTDPITIERDAQGVVRGEGSGEVQLSKNITGSAKVAWDGHHVTGEGKVAYAGEKLSGELKVQVMPESEAKQIESSKKAPPTEGTKKVEPARASLSKKEKYVVFGDGDLKFAFTDWLSGTAHVIVNPSGYATIVGEITPQKELELFPQKDFNKDLFKLEARASYGLPVVGNIFIFGNVGLNASAKLGPGKLYNIVAKGTYSTDPKQCKDFSIKGSVNISAAAGLTLRGEAGAGLQILAHDIKAGAGVNAKTEILGYAEATPIIGYREKPTVKGEDKKGEFFIRGDLEIAAQPTLGLSGDVFVEVDAPWWSPCPDKKWVWPLLGKTWPIGGSFGLNASVDYVFGSGQAPSIEFKPVDFSASKFLTDMYSNKGGKGSGKTEQKGQWKEKNSKDAEPPSKAPKVKGNAKPGKAPEMPPAKPRVKPGVTRNKDRKVDPKARTADGKTVEQHQKDPSKQAKNAGSCPCS